MAIGSSNVSFGSLQTEYGGSNPISLSEYYRGGSYVLAHPGNASIPASGAIQVSAFFNQSKRWVVAVTISSDTANFNLRSFLTSTYGDYSTIPTDVTVTINSGITVYSTSTSTPAFDTGDGWESTSTITIVNNGQISGMGGAGGVGYNGAGAAGGNAINLQYPVTINNTSGNIYAGGGGGGGGGGMYWISNGNYYAEGGGGGGGQSFSASAGGALIYGQNLTAIGYSITQYAAAGSNGTNAGPGAGGVGYQVTAGGESPTYPTAGTGGTGGAWGAAGSNGSVASGDGTILANSFGVGGAAGKAIELNGFTATFTGGNNGTQVKGAQSTQTATDTTYTQYSNGRRIYLVTLNTGKLNFNLYTHVGSPSGIVCDVTVTINTGIVVYSNSTATPAFSTGSGWGSTTTIAIINNGYIIGMGGAGGAGSTVAGGAGNSGGNALSLTNNVTITNASGFIYSGGGGGGGGGGSFHSSFGTSAQGGGGGGGQSYNSASGGTPNGGTGGSGGGGAGGAGSTASSGGEAPTLWFGGAGGAGGAYGTAGSAGSSGSAGTTNYAGGAAGDAGLAVALNGYSITFISGNDSTHVKGAQS